MSSGPELVLAPIGGGVSWALRRARADIWVQGLESTAEQPLVAWSDALALDQRTPAHEIERAVHEAVAGKVVAVDDAEHLDPASFDLLIDLLAGCRAVVGCHVGTALGRCRAERLARVLNPRELTPVTHAELVAVVRGCDPALADDEVARIALRSGGLPGIARALALGGVVETARIEQLTAVLDELDETARNWVDDVAVLLAGMPAAIAGPPPITVSAAGLVSPDGAVRPPLVLEIAASRIGPADQQRRRSAIAARCDDPIAASHLLRAADQPALARDLARRALTDVVTIAPPARARLMALAAGDELESRAAALALVSCELPDEADAALDTIDDPLAVAAISRQLDAPTRAELVAVLDPASAEAVRTTEWISSRRSRPGDALVSAQTGLDGERWRWQRALVDAVLDCADLDAVDEAMHRAPGASSAWSATVDQLSALIALHRAGPSAVAIDHLAPSPLHPTMPGALLRAHLAVLHADLGRSIAATAAVASGPASQAPVDRALHLWALAEAELQAGHPRRAARVAGDALELDVPAGWFALLAAAWGSWEIGDGIPALPPDPAAPLLRRLVEAELDALRAFETPAGAEAFEAVAAGWAGRHLRGELRASWAAAEVRRRQGEREAAVVALREVEDRADAAGFAPLVQRVRRSLRLAGVQRRGARRAADGPLSPREQEVLELVASGLSTRDIAVRLGLAESTVETQVTAAMHKLGARTRLQAATMFRELQQ